MSSINSIVDMMAVSTWGYFSGLTEEDLDVLIFISTWGYFLGDPFETVSLFSYTDMDADMTSQVKKTINLTSGIKKLEKMSSSKDTNIRFISTIL